MKNILQKFYDLGGVFFISLICLGLILYFSGYFSNYQIIWITILVIIGWLIYIYRYLEEEKLNNENNK
jgi:protein-S-isoprenylcysteine O-methyltransferase Ste14